MTCDREPFEDHHAIDFCCYITCNLVGKARSIRILEKATVLDKRSKKFSLKQQKRTVMCVFLSTQQGCYVFVLIPPDLVNSAVGH